jgi:hypothetical protein
MNIFKRWNFDFDGAYLSPDQLQPQAGVYVVWDKNGETWTVLDVGESIDVRARLKNHDRKPDWERCNKGELRYSATYTSGMNDTKRCAIERVIRVAAKPLCGVR